MSENNEVKDLMKSYFIAKKYYYDMVNDYLKIISIRKEMFKKKMTPNQIQDAEYVTNQLLEYAKKPKHKYRLYLICCVRFVAFAYVDIPLEFANNILNGLEEELSSYDEHAVSELPVDFISTVYFFENSKIKYSRHIGADHLAWIMNVLKNENLIDDCQEHRWTDNFSS